MQKGRPASKEPVFVWSAGGVKRVLKKKRGGSGPAASRHSSTPQFQTTDPRRYPRLDLKLPILYKVLGGDASKIPQEVQPYLMAESENVSPIGLCLHLAENLAPGTVLALTIHVVDRREMFSAVGCVMWTKPSGEPNRYLTGLQFVVVDGDGVRHSDHTRMETLVQEIETSAEPA